MIKNRWIFFYLFLLYLLIGISLFPTQAVCYNSGRNNPGHKELADKSIQYKKALNPALGQELIKYEETIKNATSAEDSPFWQTRHHFYNPITGKGLIPYFENARERAWKFYKSAVDSYCTGNKQKAWDDFGHALHLLQDMGSPSHVHNATHLFQAFFFVG